MFQSHLFDDCLCTGSKNTTQSNYVTENLATQNVIEEYKILENPGQSQTST